MVVTLGCSTDLDYRHTFLFSSPIPKNWEIHTLQKIAYMEDIVLISVQGLHFSQDQQLFSVLAEMILSLKKKKSNAATTSKNW